MGDKSFNITKTIVKHYKVIPPMVEWNLNFGRFQNIRDSLGLKVQKTCFNCGKKFVADEHLFLATVTPNKGNTLFCRVCAEKIATELGIEIVKAK